MKGNWMTFPLLYGLSQWNKERKEASEEAGRRARVYSGSAVKDPSATGAMDDSAASAILVWLIVLGLLCVFGLVPLAKAFQCGENPSALGVSGNTWGVVILVSLLVAPWILGLLIGAVFLVAGACRGVGGASRLPGTPYNFQDAAGFPASFFDTSSSPMM
jgi:hypothetical protein